jgi:ribulose-phosphate 3-epimerase
MSKVDDVKLAPSILAADFARLGEQVVEAEKARADRIHVDVMEGNNNLHRTVQRIKALGKRAGVAINPATPSAALEELVRDLDLVLVMTVNPGFGHQQFIRTTLPKIRRVRELVDRLEPGCQVEVDGGIDATTAPLVVRAGATVLVAGSSIFGDRDGVTAAMGRLRTVIDHPKEEPEPAEHSAF